MPDAVLVDRPAPHVVRLLINRTEKRNAIDFEVRQALIEAMTTILANPDNRAIVFGGVGGVFSAGGDVASMAGLSEAEARERMRHGHRLCRLVAGSKIPVVSAIEGFGAGAAVGLALLGDFIVAGESTKILFPFFKLGLSPDWGLLWTLPARVGLPAARRLLTEGQVIGGAEALRLGLADAFVGNGDIMAAAVSKASVLSQLPRLAFARTKARLLQPSATLDEELAREENDQATLLTGEDFAEGFAAFSEKRAANFVK